ncbi:MAG: hypothetical protein ACQERJ_06915 [Bacillota bacterium]
MAENILILLVFSPWVLFWFLYEYFRFKDEKINKGYFIRKVIIPCFLIILAIVLDIYLPDEFGVFLPSLFFTFYFALSVLDDRD